MIYYFVPIHLLLSKIIEIIEALVAQSVERQAVNLQVDCSNQSWGEFFFLINTETVTAVDVFLVVGVGMSGDGHLIAYHHLEGIVIDIAGEVLG